MVVGSPIVLNLIPGGVMPVIMINETDKGYQKEFLIYNGNTPYNVPANVSATIRGTKRDGLGVTEAATVTAGSNVVHITVTEQMTAVPGKNIFELVFVDTNGLRVATANFIMLVERSALNANTVISESDIAYSEQVLTQLQGVAAFKEQLDNQEIAKIQRYDTCVSMKADANLKSGMICQTAGYYAVNDGGAALYYVMGSAPVSDYYETLQNGLIAILVANDSVTPEMFGAYGDGTHDDTAAIQKAIDSGYPVVLSKSYNVASTLYLNGRKELRIEGSISYSGSNYLFYITGSHNIIDGCGIGICSGNANATLIYISSVKSDSSSVYSYYNKILRLELKDTAKGILLYNPEISAASYFNTVEKITFTNCTTGLELKQYANGNRLNNLVFYNCGVANTPTKACIILTEENNKYPEENNFSQIFVTNSPNVTCFYFSGKCYYNNFSQIILEPGGTGARSFYAEDPSNVVRCIFEVIDLTNQGADFTSYNSNTFTASHTVVRKIIYKERQSALSRTFAFSNSNVYAENAWVPLMTPALGNLRSMRVSIVAYFASGTAFSKQYYDELNTMVYKRQSGLAVNNTDKFKIEDGILYFKTPPTEQGGTPFTGIQIEMTVGSFYSFAAGSVGYTMSDVWTQR